MIYGSDIGEIYATKKENKNQMEESETRKPGSENLEEGKEKKVIEKEKAAVDVGTTAPTSKPPLKHQSDKKLGLVQLKIMELKSKTSKTTQGTKPPTSEHPIETPAPLVNFGRRPRENEMGDRYTRAREYFETKPQIGGNGEQGNNV